MPLKIKTTEPCKCGSRYVVNKKFNLCQYCNYRRLHEGKSEFQVKKEKKVTHFKEKRKIYKTSYRMKVPTGEAEVFRQIWEERSEHRCSHCFAWLGNIAKVWMFSHRLPKSTHPELRLDKTNIDLHCYECHYAHEFQGEEAYNKRKDMYRNDKLNLR